MNKITNLLEIFAVIIFIADINYSTVSIFEPRCHFDLCGFGNEILPLITGQFKPCHFLVNITAMQLLIRLNYVYFDALVIFGGYIDENLD